jgi:hypothetical protein
VEVISMKQTPLEWIIGETQREIEAIVGRELLELLKSNRRWRR